MAQCVQGKREALDWELCNKQSTTLTISFKARMYNEDSSDSSDHFTLLPFALCKVKGQVALPFKTALILHDNEMLETFLRDSGPY